MKKIFLTFILISLCMPMYAYKHHSAYYSTGYKKHRSITSRNEFLRENGYCSYGLKCHVPKGYQVDHIKPLSEGGADSPKNMRLLTIAEHKRITAQERKQYGW